MLSLKPLSAARSDLTSLQCLLEQAPRYAHITTAMPVSLDAAAEMLVALPPGKDYKDKFFLGIFDDGTLVGCIDLIRGYPSEFIACVGLLLIAEPYEGRGLGSRAFEQVLEVVGDWHTCTKLRLGILKTNEKAMYFWRKLGFAPTGESKPYQNGVVCTDVLLYERPLTAA